MDSVRLLLIAVCVCTTVVHAQRNEDLLARAGAFVTTVSQQLSGIVADEAYRQDLYRQVSTALPRLHIGQRSMRSEALFLQLPAAGEWMFVRNVLEVDGTPVPDSGARLDRLFRDSTIDPGQSLRQLQQENARFDMGPVVRTLGDPTFALRYLEPAVQPRFAFSRMGTQQIGAVRAIVFQFKERRRPYVVKVNQRDGQSYGSVWIDPERAAVLRTDLHVALPSGLGTIANIIVDFQSDPRLNIWVPSKMSERYFSMNDQMTSGSASYANFRRFDATVRVLPPDSQN